MAIKHATVKAPGQKLFAVADWNPNHVVDSDVPMGGFKLTALAAGAGAGDSLRYEQVVGLYGLLSGFTMGGDIVMGAHNITFTTGLVNGVDVSQLKADYDVHVADTADPHGAVMGVSTELQCPHIRSPSHLNLSCYIDGGGSVNVYNTFAGSKQALFNLLGPDETNFLQLYHNEVVGVIGTNYGDIVLAPAGDIDANANTLTNLAANSLAKEYIEDAYVYNTGDTMTGALGVENVVTINHDYHQSLIIRRNRAIAPYGCGFITELKNTADEWTIYGQILGMVITPTDGAEDGELQFSVMRSGVLDQNTMKLTKDGCIDLTVANATVDGVDISTFKTAYDAHDHSTGDPNAVDHVNLDNIGTNTHAQVDTHITAAAAHIADGTVHFIEGAIDHTAILNIGVNTHAQVDTHIADTIDPHGATMGVSTGIITPTIQGGAILNLAANTAGNGVVQVYNAAVGLHQVYFDILGPNETNYMRLYHQGTYGLITTNTGDLYLNPAGNVNLNGNNIVGAAAITASGNIESTGGDIKVKNGNDFYAYSAGNDKYMQIRHNDVDGTIHVSSGDLYVNTSDLKLAANNAFTNNGGDCILGPAATFAVQVGKVPATSYFRMYDHGTSAWRKLGLHNGAWAFF